MNTKPQYIIWAPSQGLPTVTHPDHPTALAEAQRLAAKHPAATFGIYELTATVRGEVKITVEDLRELAKPAANSEPIEEIAQLDDSMPCPKTKPHGWIELRSVVAQKNDILAWPDGDTQWAKGFIGDSIWSGMKVWRKPDAPATPKVAPAHEAAPAAIDLRTCVKGQNHPHLRPVPPELPPLPKGTVYLGRGGEFMLPATHHTFCGYRTVGSMGWAHGTSWFGDATEDHYAAFEHSEIVRINREQKEGGK